MQNHISDQSFKTQRFNMIDGQLKPNGILNPELIQAFSAISREDFVPSAHKKHAYHDAKINLTSTRVMLEPMVLAKLLQAAHPQPTDKVLVIGSAFGYSAALLAHIVTEVHALESDTALSTQATSALKKTMMKNICTHTGLLTEVPSKHGPYDLIFIDGAISELPTTIAKQLSNGGRLITLLQKKNQFCQGMLYENNENNISNISLFETEAPLLPGFEKTKSFSFAA